jgi:hypothetical protein
MGNNLGILGASSPLASWGKNPGPSHLWTGEQAVDAGSGFYATIVGGKKNSADIPGNVVVTKIVLGGNGDDPFAP